MDTCSCDPAFGARNRPCATVVRVELPCLWGKLPRRVFLDLSKDVHISFCLAGMALCDIRCVSAGMCVCVPGRGETKVAVSMRKATKTCLS